jgi:Amt family ammonium transporter
MEGGVEVSINLLWLLFGGVFIFIMQAGFAMLEAGSVRYKNHMNSLMKNALIPCIGGLVWFLFGFAFGFGNVMKNFIGRRYFALSYPNHPLT